MTNPESKPPATGNCYRDSYRALMEFERLKMHEYFGLSKRQRFCVVHGRVTAKDEATGEVKSMFHAWVEAGSIVWEPFHQMTWDRKEFYKLWQAESFGKFNSEQASRMILTRNHLGPWAGPTTDVQTDPRSRYSLHRNPDESFRKIERYSEEVGDDLHVKRKLLLEKARQGDRHAIIELQLRQLGDNLTSWAETQGRFILNGAFKLKFGSEHQYNEHCSHQNYVTQTFVTREVADEGEIEGPRFSLVWDAEIIFDEKTWAKYQKTLSDIRILRPLNQLRVYVTITNQKSGLQTIEDPFNLEIECQWLPDLVRIGSLWHSGWENGKQLLPPTHPIQEVIEIIRKHLGHETKIETYLGRQQGSADQPLPFPYLIERITKRQDLF